MFCLLNSYKEKLMNKTKKCIVMYVKKNIHNFTKIGDVHNINTRNRLNLGAPVTRLHPHSNLWDNVYAFTIGSQKTSENFLYHDLKKLFVC